MKMKMKRIEKFQQRLQFDRLDVRRVVEAQLNGIIETYPLTTRSTLNARRDPNICLWCGKIQSIDHGCESKPDYNCWCTLGEEGEGVAFVKVSSYGLRYVEEEISQDDALDFGAYNLFDEVSEPSRVNLKEDLEVSGAHQVFDECSEPTFFSHQVQMEIVLNWDILENKIEGSESQLDVSGTKYSGLNFLNMDLVPTIECESKCYLIEEPKVFNKSPHLNFTKEDVHAEKLAHNGSLECAHTLVSDIVGNSQVIIPLYEREILIELSVEIDRGLVLNYKEILSWVTILYNTSVLAPSELIPVCHQPQKSFLHLLFLWTSFIRSPKSDRNVAIDLLAYVKTFSQPNASIFAQICSIFNKSMTSMMTPWVSNPRCIFSVSNMLSSWETYLKHFKNITVVITWSSKVIMLYIFGAILFTFDPGGPEYDAYCVGQGVVDDIGWSFISIALLGVLTDDFYLAKQHKSGLEKGLLNMSKTITSRILSSCMLKELSDYYRQQLELDEKHLYGECLHDNCDAIYDAGDHSFPYSIATANSGSTLVLVGLHACGDLFVTMLWARVECEAAKAVVSIGCCYKLLSEDGIMYWKLSHEHQNTILMVMRSGCANCCHSCESQPSMAWLFGVVCYSNAVMVNFKIATSPIAHDYDNQWDVTFVFDPGGSILSYLSKSELKKLLKQPWKQA